MSNYTQLRNTLVQELRDVQSKHTYFLMASAGAALGFGVQKLDGQLPGHPLYVGLSAMALWVLSFAFGCIVMTGTQALVRVNMDLINYVDRNDFPAADAADKRSRSILHRINRCHFYQFASLSVGVILFAVWRVLLIYHPPYTPTCLP